MILALRRGQRGCPSLHRSPHLQPPLEQLRPRISLTEIRCHLLDCLIGVRLPPEPLAAQKDQVCTPQPPLDPRHPSTRTNGMFPYRLE